MADLVHVRRPDGTVIAATRVAFETLHRPKGWQEVRLEGVNPEPRILFLSAVGGGERVRSRWPAEALKNTGWRSLLIQGWPGGLTPGDVIVFHRPLAHDILEWVMAYREAGLKVLVSEDDHLERIPKLNRWQADAEQLARHAQAIREADGLVVTTPALSEVYGPLAKRTWLCPNYLPAWVSGDEFLAKRQRAQDRITRVGWAGVVETHRQDLDWLKPAAAAMVQGAKFTTVGAMETPRILGIRGEAYPRQIDIERFYRLMGRADIGIVPLDNGENRDFNTGKSWLKSLEYVSLGIPVVATDLPEHRALLEGTGAGFLVDTPRAMADAVQVLVHDRALRQEMADAALALGRRMVLENHIDCWAAPLRALTGS